MTYFLKLYPPLMQDNERYISCIEEPQEAIKVSSIVNKILNKGIDGDRLKYKPECLSFIVNDRVVDKEYKVENGDYVKIMLAGIDF